MRVTLAIFARAAGAASSATVVVGRLTPQSKPALLQLLQGQNEERDSPERPNSCLGENQNSQFPANTPSAVHCPPAEAEINDERVRPAGVYLVFTIALRLWRVAHATTKSCPLFSV